MPWSTGWRHVASDLDRCFSLVGRRNCHELPKDLAFGGRSTKEVLHASQSRQQRLKGATDAGSGTYAKQIFRAGIEIDKRPIRIDNQDGCSKAGENIPRQRRRIGVGRLR